MKTGNKSHSFVIKSGRAFNGFHKDAGIIVHIIDGIEPNGFWGGKALCGAEPGYRGNGWHEVPKNASCEKCIKRHELELTPATPGKI